MFYFFLCKYCNQVNKQQFIRINKKLLKAIVIKKYFKKTYLKNNFLSLYFNLKSNLKVVAESSVEVLSNHGQVSFLQVDVGLQEVSWCVCDVGFQTFVQYQSRAVHIACEQRS